MGRRHNPCFRKLLVGFDGSEPATRATEVAMQLAECLDTEILLFAVARPPEPAPLVEVMVAPQIVLSVAVRPVWACTG